MARVNATVPERVAGVLTAIATAVVITAIAIVPFLSPAWVSFEQGRSGAEQLTGYTTAELRTATDGILADQVDATPNDVLAWRDEALMLNLASFGPQQHQLLMQGGIEGLRDILDLSLDDFRAAIIRAATELKVEEPSDLTMVGWWEQAKTLEDA